MTLAKAEMYPCKRCKRTKYTANVKIESIAWFDFIEMFQAILCRRCIKTLRTRLKKFLGELKND